MLENGGLGKLMSFPLIGFISILVIEYLGITYYYVPQLGALPVTLVFALVLFFYLVRKNGLGDLLKSAQTKVLLVFILLTGFAMAHGLIQSYAIGPFKTEIGYFILLAIGFYVLRVPGGFPFFATAMVLIHSFLVVINFDKFLLSQRVGVFRAGYFLGDGNDFAWSLTICLAFAFYLVTSSKSVILRLLGVAGGLLIVIGIVGTQSRGATLAMIGAVLYFWLIISKRKLLWLFGLALVSVFVASIAPEGYFSRMETISSYEEDTSATNRLKAWGHAIDMAIDHPILGVGAGSFNSAYGRNYRGEGDPARWISTHSVYFRILGEYGFVGIALFLFVLLFNFFENRAVARLLQGSPGLSDIPNELPDYINMAIVAYAVAGTFLGGVDYPHIYLLTAATLATKWMVMNQLQQDTTPAEENNESVVGNEQR